MPKNIRLAIGFRIYDMERCGQPPSWNRSIAHPHRFRDTFAVDLLLAGVPLEQVSILLGHASIRITEKHYSPWIRDRQAQLEASLERAWAQDPVVLAETKGTPKVHGKTDAVN